MNNNFITCCTDLLENLVVFHLVKKFLLVFSAACCRTLRDLLPVILILWILNFLRRTLRNIDHGNGILFKCQMGKTKLKRSSQTYKLAI